MLLFLSKLLKQKVQDGFFAELDMKTRKILSGRKDFPHSVTLFNNPLYHIAVRSNIICNIQNDLIQDIFWYWLVGEIEFIQKLWATNSSSCRNSNIYLRIVIKSSFWIYFREKTGNHDDCNNCRFTRHLGYFVHTTLEDWICNCFNNTFQVLKVG